MELILAVLASLLVALGGLFVATISRLFSDEFKAWAPWIIERLICFAVSRLPARYRKRLSEEWRSHIAQVPGDIGKIIVAFGFIRASRTIRHRVRVARFQRAFGLFWLIMMAPLMALISISLFLEHRQSPITKSKVTGRLKFRTELGGRVSTSVRRLPGLEELPALIDVVMGRAVIYVRSRKEITRGARRDHKRWLWWFGR
jgi:hypothetical protein